ncbi:MAG TPA: hypothetical protein PKY81_08240 [bacterium]|nr:hypothetical protein [bacterium]HPN30933.1 hypothetical protein [bacterium]
MGRNNKVKIIFQIVIFILIVGFIASTFISMDDSIDNAETQIEKLTETSDVNDLKEIKKIKETLAKDYTTQELQQKFSELQ